ncbi:hypothetical protein CSOJ01_15581 [Colletotrichum sojae]|uniref:Uncharacterized protein n=1 Tax=Colletotrichum sojae TaxID=2175907 RepID=A0A8H6ILZ1_9PEZI|nr:hypothetical protein CSOJ01_15581 [Colletotrichum sojae]
MEEVTASLKRSKKKQLQEVADGMLKVYRTLVRMRYLEDEWIHEGPHDMTAVLPLCRRLGIDDSIIYLYSILPYVDTYGAESVDFFKGGDFVDLRDVSEINEARNPMYADDEREVLRPWMTALSAIGNHDTALIYDARKHVIGMFNQMDYVSTDPHIHERVTGFFDEEEFLRMDEEERRVRETKKFAADDDNGDESETMDEEDDDTDDGGEEDDEIDTDDGDDDWEDDENVWDEMDARPADTVLRQMVAWYEGLAELPGGGERSGREWAREITKPLYEKHGWPRRDFDGDAFLAHQARAHALGRARYDAEEPLRKLRETRDRVQAGEAAEARAKKELSAADAADPEEAWLARWRAWREGFLLREARRELREHEEKAERTCPGGQAVRPGEEAVRELRILRGEVAYQRGDLERREGEVEAAGGPEKASAPLLVRRAHAVRRLAVLQKALDACAADVGDGDVSPGRGVDEPGLDLDEMLAHHTRGLKQCEIGIEALRGWLSEVPGDVKMAREEAERMLEGYERSIGHFEKGRSACLPKDADLNVSEA